MARVRVSHFAMVRTKELILLQLSMKQLHPRKYFSADASKLKQGPCVTVATTKAEFAFRELYEKKQMKEGFRLSSFDAVTVDFSSELDAGAGMLNTR